MEVRSPVGTSHAVHLPPSDRRVTPPPEDMNRESPKSVARSTTALPLTHYHGAQGDSDAARAHGPRAPTTPTSPTITRAARRSTNPACLGADAVGRPSIASNPVFCPRPYEALYAERAYVTTLLQAQAARVGRLIWQYEAVDAQLDTVETAMRRRQLRKQLSLLTARCNEAREQHRVLSVRLSELSLEVQSRETWGEVQRQRRNRQPRQVPNQRDNAHIPRSASGQSPETSSSSPCFSTSPSPASWAVDTPATPLNGATPEFVPRQEAALCCVPNGIGPPMGGLGGTATTELETVNEAAETNCYKQELEYEYCSGGDDKAGRPGSERRKSWDEMVTTPVERRPSLPNLQSLWVG